MSKKVNKTQIIEDIDDVLNEEYKNYYNNILEQMSKQGFSKVHIAVQRKMYETRDDLFETFVERYEFSDPIFEVNLEK